MPANTHRQAEFQNTATFTSLEKSSVDSMKFKGFHPKKPRIFEWPSFPKLGRVPKLERLTGPGQASHRLCTESSSP